MGKIVNSLCNKIIVTDDNPRREKPELIRKAIIKHIKKEKVVEEGNRVFAVHSAIKYSNPNEIILIAGKGHEDIQDYGKKKYKISDFTIVKNYKIKKNKSKKEINFQHNNFLINKITNQKLDKGFSEVSIDSKSVKKNNLFLAIKGKNNDGHNYLEKLLLKELINA